MFTRSTRVFSRALSVRRFQNQCSLFSSSSSSSSSSIADLVRPITVTTCVGLYPRLQQKHPRLFPLKVPTGGVQLTVQYADTANCRLKRPGHQHEKTIVAVPGCPGYYAHFDWLLAHYRASPTVRVIALNLPDFSHTRSTGGLFGHTAEEKVAFLRDLLRQLSVQSVDCLVAHSMGFHTATGLVEAGPPDITVKSVALFAPQPIWDMTPAMKSFVEKTVFRYRGDLWYRLLELLKVHQSQRLKLRFDSIDEFLWLMATVSDEQTPLDAYRRIYRLRKQSPSVPVVVQYGSKEPIVSRRAARRLFAEFGLEDDKRQLIEVDVDDRRAPEEIVGGGGPLSLAEADCSSDHQFASSPVHPRVRGFLTKGGGHFAFAKQANVTLAVIEQLLHCYPQPHPPTLSPPPPPPPPPPSQKQQQQQQQQQ
ncbi:hypothetical protein TYRP_011573 [Tyrophagus putrescentiae]|nr:hypothetical protein TYRP_011573 [Tyrophagus putrescentiae]